jgi:hypothetical protein
VTAKAPRCNTRLELTVGEFLLLGWNPGAGRMVPARLRCEMEHGHGGDHFAFAQTGEGVSGSRPCGGWLKRGQPGHRRAYW